MLQTSVRGVPGADAFEHVLMSALKSYSVIWDSASRVESRDMSHVETKRWPSTY